MIQIQQLSKKYNQQEVLKDIDLEILPGHVYALLGKNGAGKTTIIRSILDLIRIDNGAITLFEAKHQYLDADLKAKIGVVGDDLALIEELNAYDYIELIGSIYDLSKAELKGRIDDLFAYFFEDLKVLKKPMAKYSTGMKKKMAFCAAIIHKPDFLILDEPFSGLDPLVANQMINFIQKYANQERAVLISSHDLNYVQKIATHICVLDKAELVFNDSVRAFTEGGAEHLDEALLKVLKPNDAELDKISWL
jgi:ABC-2 type transport system ATP-binding protein